MARDLLALVRAACAELALPEPALVINNEDPQVRQFLALSQAEGEEMVKEQTRTGGWQALQKTHLFNLVPGQTEYDLPSDFDHAIPQTYWDRNFRWQMLGPLLPTERQTILSGITPVGPRLRFWITANKLVVNPTPGATQTDTIVFEYGSNGWCADNTGTPQTQWAADTDVYLLDERSFILGLKWRFLRAKGLDYAEEKKQWEVRRDQMIAQDAGNRRLPINASAGELRLLGGQNVPDTGFGA